jgi:hypothetical protein
MESILSAWTLAHSFGTDNFSIFQLTDSSGESATPSRSPFQKTIGEATGAPKLVAVDEERRGDKIRD